MPYIPSCSTAANIKSEKVSEASSNESVSSEIDIDMLSERRSSLEIARRASTSIASPSHSFMAKAIQSTAVVKYSSSSDPAPLARLAEQTDLNLPPSNWLRDNPATKGFV